MATDAYGSPDDGLELERIAVGPYCVADFSFNASPQQPQPPSRPEPPPSLARTNTDGSMEDPMMSSDFPFGGMRGPWLTTAGDDMTLAAPADDLSSWNEWMQYNPAAGPQNPPNPQQSQSQSQSQSQAQSQSQPPPSAMASAQATSGPVSAPMYAHAGVPFTFGGTVDMPAAFDFNGNALSSPSTADPHQQNGFYSPPMWQQQPQPQQPLYTPTAFAQPGPPASTPSLHHSPGSLNNGTSSSHSSPEPAPTSKKRKSTEDTDDFDDAPLGKKGGSQPPKKTAHNMIEKRYRTNLNDKIAALRDSVPSLRVMSRPNGTEEDDDPEDLEGLTPAHKLNKATVLSKATEYIRHLEKRNKRLTDEVATLKGRIESYEKMAISGPMTLHGTVATPDGSRFQEDPFAHHMPMAGPPQGMIPVPDNIRALQQGLPPQQHYAHAYPQYPQGRQPQGPPMVNGRRSSAMMGKLMVGSLAGLMILEGFSSREQSHEEPSGRGLFALPIHLHSILSPTTSFGSTTAQIPIAKLLLVFGAFFYIFAPWFEPKPKQKKKTTPAFMLQAAPSLASPVEVRRKAWLTAIQTVWVPQHNFVYEVAALALKMLKLSTRRIIGWDGYAYLTGTTKDQEVARVKAWNIALDAQLTGGDAEISKSRLVLSLMASGTLPDTPARLMLKALHIRVLLWEVSSTKLGGWQVLDEFSAKLARSYWNAARSEHRIACNQKGTEAEPLPEHLAALIERECDEVLVAPIIQRAYNLAWNRPNAENAAVDLSMDGVVEDFAISSPLDALAAWYSSLVLNRGLAAYLATKKADSTADLDLALQIAPANSQAQMRALAADAVVFDEDRDARIAKALEALPTPPSSKASKTGLNLVGDSTVAVDVRKALTLAKCLSLIESHHRSAHKRAIYVVNNTFLPECTTTLLSFVAGYKVLTHFMEDDSLQAQTTSGLERIASALRMWIGHENGRRNGLLKKTRVKIVDYCVKTSKTLVGLADIDDGYVSASVKDDASSTS